MREPKAPFDVTAQLPALKRYALMLTRDESRAEDLVQDTLLRAYESRHTFRAEGNLRSWLFSILHNAFINDVKRNRADATRLDRYAEIAQGEQGEPEQESRVRLAQIQQAFMTLHEDQRTVLYLVAVEGMSYQEAAETLGIPVGTLMSRLGRARQALRAVENNEQAAGDAPAAAFRIVGGTDVSRS
jgi:RNA polymerase sigma-70 factor, ECF subfamily